MHSSDQTPPLLESFLREGRGTVFYKAYPPFRGDDVQATVELAAMLPQDVKFVPVLPKVPHMFDTRLVMNKVRPLMEKRDMAGRNFKTLNAEPKRELVQLVEESLPQDKRADAENLLQQIFKEHPAFAYALEAMIPSGSFTDRFDPSRFSSVVPDEGPVLVIGRPSLFRDDEENGPRSLQSVLRSAGFPNRFDFVQPLGDELHETSMIQDRRKHLIYEKVDNRRDVGFVFSGFADPRQPLIVACGTSSFGTYSAVRLLMQDRPVVRHHCEIQANSSESIAIDLAFRCWQTSELGWRDPAIEIINSRNATGFRWTQVAATRFRDLLGWWSSQNDLNTTIQFPEDSSELMKWEWNAHRSGAPVTSASW